MPKEIKCPKCGKSNVEEKKRKIAVGAGGGPQGAEYPPEEDYYYFKCLDCRHEFDESDLSE